MGNINVVLLIIIGANVVFSLLGFKDRALFEKYKFNVGSIKRGEQIRMVSSAFLHADMMHLFFNMFTLYFFAPIVIEFLGSTKFLIVYFCSLVIGGMLSLYFHRDSNHYSAIGASGAVSGIIYSAILFRPEMSLYLMFIPIPIPAYIFGIGYLLYSIFGMKNKIGNIGHDAHFGGAVGGYLITLLFAPWLFQKSMLMVVLLAIPIVILLVLKKLNKF